MQTKNWFPAKRYSWGWGFPCAWQGWLVFVAFLALIIARLSFVRVFVVSGKRAYCVSRVIKGRKCHDTGLAVVLCSPPQGCAQLDSLTAACGATKHAMGDQGLIRSPVPLITAVGRDPRMSCYSESSSILMMRGDFYGRPESHHQPVIRGGG